MKLLKEALVDVKRMDDEASRDDEHDLDVESVLDLPDDESAKETPPDDLEGEDFDDSSDGDDLPIHDPADPNADADAPWGALDALGGGMGGAPEDSEGEEPVDGADPETDENIDSIANKASDDPNRQGLVRTVRGAHLVYKREVDNGFEELWIYNVTTLQDEMIVRKAILAGTDIPPNKSSSPDGSQTYKVWSAGNAEMLLVTGLQN